MIVVIGSTGQLGQELIRGCDEQGYAYCGLTHDSIGVESMQSVQRALDGIGVPVTAVINTAAFHDLQKCEEDPVRAYAVNAEGSANVAKWCASHGAKYVYVSSDYVGGTPTDESGFPLSVYAKSKLAGEVNAVTICPDALVARVGTMYGVAGCSGKVGRGNFIDTVVAKIKQQEPFTLPGYTSVLTTYAKDAARRIVTRMEETGVWYATDGCCGHSHYAIGETICRYLGLPSKIQAISYDPNDTLRPSKTEVAHRRWLALSIFTLGPVPVTDPIHDYLIEKGHINA